MVNNTDTPPAAKNKQSYNDSLRAEFETLIDALTLDDLHKRMLKRRWLDQILWMEGRAGSARNQYYLLRLITIIGGILIPVCTTLSQMNIWFGFPWLTTVLGTVVAIAAAVDGFFRYGERWRHYRTIVETVKSEGWRFFQLTGHYSQYATHQEAYGNFAQNVEEILKEDVNRFITEVANKPGEKDQAASTGAESADRVVEPEAAVSNTDRPVEPEPAASGSETIDRPAEPDSAAGDDTEVTVGSVEQNTAATTAGANTSS